MNTKSIVLLVFASVLCGLAGWALGHTYGMVGAFVSTPLSYICGRWAFFEGKEK